MRKETIGESFQDPNETKAVPPWPSSCSPTPGQQGLAQFSSIPELTCYVTQGTKVVVAPPLAASTPLLLPKTLAIKKIPHNLLINANVSITRFLLLQLTMIEEA